MLKIGQEAAKFIGKNIITVLFPRAKDIVMLETYIGTLLVSTVIFSYSPSLHKIFSS